MVAGYAPDHRAVDNEVLGMIGTAQQKIGRTVQDLREGHQRLDGGQVRGLFELADGPGRHPDRKGQLPLRQVMGLPGGGETPRKNIFQIHGTAP